MQLVVDFQGFKLENNKFLVKEFACYDGLRISHYVFKPPFPLRMLSPDLHRQAVWLMNNHHGIDWKAGFTPLHQFGGIVDQLTKGADMVYVKGREKLDILKKYCTRPVYEFDEHPPLERTQPKCFHHNNDICACALSNVFFLYDNFIMAK